MISENMASKIIIIMLSKNKQGNWPLNSRNTSFLSTNDKKKIKVSESNSPISAVTSGRKVLVAHGQLEQATDHDFSSITLTPTSVLMNEIPENVDDSWHRGRPYVFIKIAATEPSNAMRNAAELKETILKKYGTV